MEEVNLDNMEGENWSVKKHTVHKDKYVARHINIWGSEAHTVDSLTEAMEIIVKFQNQEDWILQKREEFGEYMWNNDNFRKDITKGT
jgi:hypothetical protein